MSLPKPYPPILIKYTDWNEIVDSIENRPPQFVVYEDGGNWYAKDLASGVDGPARADPHDAIETDAIGGMTAGRTWKETVTIKGDAILGSTVIVPNYTHIKIRGRIKAPPLAAAFQDAAGPIVHAEIEGGTIYGDAAVASNQRGIYFAQAADCDFHNTYFTLLDDALNISFGARQHAYHLTVESCYNGIMLNEFGSHANLLTDTMMNDITVHTIANDGFWCAAGANGTSITDSRAVSCANYGVYMRDVYSGAWLTTVVVDQCGNDGIYIGPGCSGIQMTNVWALGNGGHGIDVDGSGAVGPELAAIHVVNIANATVQYNEYTGIRTKNVHKLDIAGATIIDNAQRYTLNPADDYATNVLIDEDSYASISGGRIGWYFTAPTNRVSVARIILAVGASALNAGFFDGVILGDANDMTLAHVAYHNAHGAHTIFLHTKDMCIGDTAPWTTVAIMEAGSTGTVRIYESDMSNDTVFNSN